MFGLLILIFWVLLLIVGIVLYKNTMNDMLNKICNNPIFFTVWTCLKRANYSQHLGNKKQAKEIKEEIKMNTFLSKNLFISCRLVVRARLKMSTSHTTVMVQLEKKRKKQKWLLIIYARLNKI
jgi:hypothetical protein